MSFSYDPSTNVGKVRTEIGDTVLEQGILPEGVNLSNEEIQGYLDTEGSNVMRAVAHTFEVVARRWAIVPTSASLGPESHRRDTAAFFRAEAQRLRAIYGYPSEEAMTAANRPVVSGMVPVIVHPAPVDLDAGKVYG